MRENDWLRASRGVRGVHSILSEIAGAAPAVGIKRSSWMLGDTDVPYYIFIVGSYYMYS